MRVSTSSVLDFFVVSLSIYVFLLLPAHSSKIAKLPKKFHTRYSSSSAGKACPSRLSRKKPRCRCIFESIYPRLRYRYRRLEHQTNPRLADACSAARGLVKPTNPAFHGRVIEERDALSGWEFLTSGRDRRDVEFSRFGQPRAYNLLILSATRVTNFWPRFVACTPTHTSSHTHTHDRRPLYASGAFRDLIN